MDKIFDIEFYYLLDQIRGTASIAAGRIGDQVIYTARNIQFFNTDEELNEAGLVREEELVVMPVLNADTGEIDWVEFDSEEESELAILIGHAIEKHNE